jgi:hypothetical protein
MGRGAMPHCRDALGGDSGVDPRPKHATVGEAVGEDAAINATAPQWPVRRLHIGDAEVATRSSPWRSVEQRGEEQSSDPRDGDGEQSGETWLLVKGSRG